MLRLARESGARVLASAMEAEGRLPLWRVPIVCPSPASAALLAKEGVHLGISRLYVRPLPQIIGMDTADVAARWPNAAWVAERLITLPTHGRLGERLESELRKLLERHLR
jgi:dTDP-4-amino-4,6-dideoxygalactose transaminase